jgi:calcineurin-like phosphoesterase family protein
MDLSLNGDWISPELIRERTAEMDKIIIDRWNSRVKTGDLVIHAGDFCFKNSTEAIGSRGFDFYRSQLNGDIVFIEGNHDGKRNDVRTVIQNMVIKAGGEFIYITHNPKFVPMNKWKINLIGHVHNAWKYQKRSDGSILINVGVDVNNFMPKSINEILNELATWRKYGK